MQQRCGHRQRHDPPVAGLGVELEDAAVVDALNSQEIREKFAAQIMEPLPTTPEEFRARIEADVARWKPVIEAANIKMN